MKVSIPSSSGLCSYFRRRQRDSPGAVSIPSSSGLCSYCDSIKNRSFYKGLNPFFVRSVFVRIRVLHQPVVQRLNPFFVRSVFVR